MLKITKFLKNPFIYNNKANTYNFSKRSYALKSHVILSKERHDELMIAELNDFAQKPSCPLYIHEIKNTKNTNEGVKFLHNELSIRFASRVKQLQNLPHAKNDNFVKNVQNIYFESFRQLRNSDYHSLDDFTVIVKNLKKRHANIVPMLVTGIRRLMLQYPEQLTTEVIDNFLNSFFLSRIGTEMLTSNFLTPNGIVETGCDVMTVLKRAAEDAEKLCTHHYSTCPQIMIWNVSPQRLSYVPQYLYYILFELLKNAMRAVVEYNKMNNPHRFSPLQQFCYSSNKKLEYDKKINFEISHTNKSFFNSTNNNKNINFTHEIPPIKIVLSGDDKNVAIKLSDQGGGIPQSALNKIWSYMYTTARPVTIRLKLKQENGVNSLTPTVGSLDTFATSGYPTEYVSPLAGFGCGLPLSKLYASYLGGTLQLVSMPNFGTDSFLFLDRIGDIKELTPQN